MYRTIDTATWGDPWFEELAPPAKLLFLYLITNSRTSMCGAYPITLRTMSNETCLSVERITDILPTFGDRVIWFPDERYVFVLNFYRHQRAKSSEKYRIGAAREVPALPAEVRDRVLIAYPELGIAYPEPDAPVIPHAYPMDRASTDTDTDTDTETKTKTKAETETGEQPRVTARPSRAPVKTVLPNPFEISDAMWTWAEGNGYPTGFIEDATEYFVDWARSNGHKRADWTGTWRNMMRSKWSEQNGKVRTLRRA